MNLVVSYDTSIMTLKSLSFGTPFMDEVSFLHVASGAEIFTLNGMCSSLESNCSSTGVLATATFTISSNAPVGSVANIRVTFDPNDIIDANSNNVSTAVRDGSVTVVG